MILYYVEDIKNWYFKYFIRDFVNKYLEEFCYFFRFLLKKKIDYLLFCLSNKEKFLKYIIKGKNILYIFYLRLIRNCIEIVYFCMVK